MPIRNRTGFGEEGGSLPKAHDGEARQLRLPLGYLSRPLHWHHRDWNPLKVRERADLPAARGRLER